MLWASCIWPLGPQIRWYHSAGIEIFRLARHKMEIAMLYLRALCSCPATLTMLLEAVVRNMWALRPT